MKIFDLNMLCTVQVYSCHTYTNAQKIGRDSILHLSRIMRKPAFCICENKGEDQLGSAETMKLISAFVFATYIVLSLYPVSPKFQASSHLQWLHSQVCVQICVGLHQ